MRNVVDFLGFHPSRTLYAISRRSFRGLAAWALLMAGICLIHAIPAAAIVVNGTTQLTAPTTTAPGSIAGLIVQLDANSVNGGVNPANGTQLSTWTNLAAGGAGDFTGGASPYLNWTGNLMNGQPVVHFWGGTLSNNTNFGNNVTVLYTARLDGGANARVLSGRNNNWLLGYWSGRKNTNYWNGSPQNLTGDGAGSADYVGHIFVGTADGITASSYNADAAEVSYGSGALGGSGQGPNGLVLGGSLASELSYADIGELLVFNRALTGAERLQMEQYLQGKWYGDFNTITSPTEAVSITGTGTLDLNGVNQTIGSLAGDPGSHVLLNGGFLTTGQNNTSTTYSGDIANGSVSGGGLSKIGTGTLTLAGASANTFTGPTQFSQGGMALSKSANTTALGGDILMTNSLSPTMWMTADGQLSSSGVLSFVSEVNALVGNARVNLRGTTQTLAGIVETDAQRGGVIQNSETIGGAPTNNGNSTLVLAGSGNYSFNGYLRNQTGTLGLNKTGDGTQTLVGNRITYTGATIIDDGTLELTNTTGFNSATSVNSGAELKLTNTANMGNGAGFTIALNNGGTLIHNGLTNNSAYITLAGAVTNSGTTTIEQNSVTNTTGVNKSLFLDGGLKGTGTVTVNALNPGNGVVFRNNNTTFAGTMIVNGIASTTANAGSGIGVGGATTGLINADITLNGTMELLNQGVGWAAAAPGDFWMGALNGTGVMVGNFTAGGQTRVRIGNTDNDGSFSGTIANGTGNVVVLTKLGAGTQTLSGTNLYTGLTSVNDGSLVIDGSIVGAVDVNNGGTLGGTGTVGGLVTLNSGGTISPGDSPGAMANGSGIWNGGNYLFEINDATGAAGTNWDLLNLGNSLDISALNSGNQLNVLLTSLNGSSPGEAANFDKFSDYDWLFADAVAPIIGYTGSDQFIVDASAFANDISGYTPGSFSVLRGDSVGGDNTQLFLHFTAAQVPEPSTILLVALGALLLGLRRRKNR